MAGSGFRNIESSLEPFPSFPGELILQDPGKAPSSRRNLVTVSPGHMTHSLHVCLQPQVVSSLKMSPCRIFMQQALDLAGAQ